MSSLNEQKGPQIDIFIQGSDGHFVSLDKVLTAQKKKFEKQKTNYEQQAKVNQELLKIHKHSMLREMIVPLCIVAALATNYIKPSRQIERVVSAGMVGAGATYLISGYVLHKKKSKLNNQLKILKKQEQSLG